jgi:putative ABC transport system permease protein
VIRTGLIESLLLSFAGTAASLLVLTWSETALRAALPPVFSSYTARATDPRVLGFALLTAVLCTLVAGAYPSWRVSRVPMLPFLRRGEVASTPRRLYSGSTLLLVEAALSVILVAGAALTVRSFATLSLTDLGFEPDHLHSVLAGSPGGSDPGERFQQSQLALQAVSSSPGVIAAAAVDINPLSGAMGSSLLGPGLTGAFRWRVTSTFFTAMQMRQVAGRPLSAAEVATDAAVGVLSESGLRLVRPDLPAGDAIGRILRFPGERDLEIVGVVGDVRASHADPPIPSLYLPLTARDFRRAELVVRFAPGAAPSLSDLRLRLQRAGVPVTTISMSDVSQGLRRRLTDQRFRALLFSMFGATALVLAALGLYVVGAYEVSRREREMGIRLAIGGSAGSVRWLVMRHTLTPVLVGLVAGLAGTYWAATFLQSFLYQVDARDPAMLAGVAIALFASTALAGWLATRRATRVDPVTVLRAQ